MQFEQAQMWAEIINQLLSGHRVAFIDVYEWRGWEPNVKLTTLNSTHAFPYDHDPLRGHFNISSDYGVHDGLDEIHVRPDEREISMYSKTAAGGQAIWRVIKDLDVDGTVDNWRAWKDAQQRVWASEDVQRGAQ